MPQHKSAAKRVRQNETRRLRNRYHKSRVRSMIKKLESMDDAQAAQAYFDEVKAYLDRLATKRILSPNRVAHTKSRLQRRVSALA